MVPDRVILLNGPPRVGKDTSAALIEELCKTEFFTMPYEYVLERFSMPLKYATLALINVFSLEDPLALELEANKDQPHYLFSGRSYRQMQIALSEQLIKRYLIKEQFGVWAVHRLQQWRKIYPTRPCLFVFPDSGFIEETSHLLSYIPPHRCCLIRLHREGKDFSNDSRGYIDLSESGVPTFDVTNNASEDALQKRLSEVLDKWLSMET